MMRHMLHAVLPLLLLLLCFARCSVAAETFRCIFDELQRKLDPLNISVVQRAEPQGGGMARGHLAAKADWAAIRIRVFTEDMEDRSRYCGAKGQMRPDFTGTSVACEGRDILTLEKKNAILNEVLPRAVRLHADRLLVKPTVGSFVIPRFSSPICSEFTIPADHHTSGVSSADMVMYAAAGPTGGSTLAWALTCALLNDKRPFVGMMNFGPHSLSVTEYTVRVAAHEMAHALGFGYDQMSARGMVSATSNVRGKPTEVNIVSSPKTLEKVRAHYNCASAVGMELEDEGGEGTANSHWERRNAKDELMAGIAGSGYYTALTMAAFEDMGFFKANWGREEPMGWGNNSGCDLLTGKCVNGGITKYPDMFCTEKRDDVMLCTSDRLSLGHCGLYIYSANLPVEYRYFADAKQGGSDALMDYCPYIQEYGNTGCTDGDARAMPGSRVSPSSRCVKMQGSDGAMNSVDDVCVEVSCNNSKVSVRYLGNNTWHPCPEGEILTPTTSLIRGKIVCPTYTQVCTAMGDYQGGDNSGDSARLLKIPAMALVLAFALALC